MQKVSHDENLHPVFDDMEKFYAYTSEINAVKTLVKPIFPKNFEKLVDLFNQYGIRHFDLNYKKMDYPVIQSDANDKTMIVVFSGGKDSTATALYYKQHGYDVILYHALGLNVSYPDEWKRAEEIAEYLDMPLVKEKFTLEGKKDFIEHPLKNIIIVNGAINYAIKNNLPINIAVGNYTDDKASSLEENPFYICGDDCIEMWQAYEYSMQDVIPGFKVNLCLENVQNTYEILTQDMKLFELTQSCLGPQRFRQWTHEKNESKYNIKLLNNRCGSCWKCAYEYIWLTDHDLIEYNRDYYKHCLDVLVKEDKREYNLEFEGWDILWNDWFTHESKYFNEV